MNFHPESVSRPMAEIFSITIPCDDISRQGVPFFTCHTRLKMVQGVLISLSDDFVNFAVLVAWFAYYDGACNIRAISIKVSPVIQFNEFVPSNDPIAGNAMRQS